MHEFDAGKGCRSRSEGFVPQRWPRHSLDRSVVLFKNIIEIFDLTDFDVRQGGYTGAGRALALANKPAHFLSTVQFGITIISILSGAMGEATLHDEVAESLSRIAWLQPYADRLAFWCGRCRCTDRRWRHRSRQRSAPNDYLT